MHAAPLIGLTTYGRNESNRYTLPAEYVEAVRRAGGIPLLIAPGEADLAQLVGAIDALILTGGGDLDPMHYGGQGHPLNYAIDAERDAAEIRLAELALDAELPTLGICRGVQIINVVLGGTLIEHVPDEVGESCLHRAPPREPVPHPVTISGDSRLAAVVEAGEVQVASWHHQALREVAHPLRVVAWAPDGIVEAVEHTDHPWLIGVQWHPELTAATDARQQRLFNGLVTAALGRRA